ncbi:uncharacterized protein [Clytia hemisphaerica]|uniref:Uncharacterized protein n=1 Tax=Clytia hemisphaerica TaxID=252671 RepID=A0A7M5UXJ4_9CNID
MALNSTSKNLHEHVRKLNVQFERTNRPIIKAFGEEVHLFMHIHLRGYDKNGDGKQMHAEYYDKFGAPMKKEDSWLDGFRSVEEEIANHFNKCQTDGFDFPMPAAVAGGSHLYAMYHYDKPWNWTGFVPGQKKWCCHNEFFQNRHFMQIRGNEIQNNLWDYDPHAENEGSFEWDLKYDQIVPDDEYHGGYWFFNNPWGRYLHIISLKSMHPEPQYCKRYNYIVHPLAYRGAETTLVDESVDAMQWSICNANNPKHNIVPEGRSTVMTFPAFGADQLSRWGDRCHGVEVFNDFTYYYSASPLDETDDPWKGGNGFLYNKEGTPNNYFHWFNSYPLEFGEFLVETSLRYGSYMQMVSANDAMYVRETREVDRETKETTAVVRTEPRQHTTTKLKIDHQFHALTLKKTPKETSDPNNPNRTFLGGMPYEQDTIFGYTTLIDPEMKLKRVVYGPPPYVPQVAQLDEGESEVLDYLISGHFFGHTGIYEIFNYRDRHNRIQQNYPIIIDQQNPRAAINTFIDDLHVLILTMPKAQKKGEESCKSQIIAEHIIWQFTVGVHKEDTKQIECHRGYFKLNEDYRTRLDLTEKIDESEVAWIRIQAYDVRNPQRRAWFQPIKGPMFGKVDWKRKVDLKTILNPTVHNYVYNMAATTEMYKSEDFIVYRPEDNFEPEAWNASNLVFDLDRIQAEEEDHLCVYNLQVHSLKQLFGPDNKKTRNASTELPPTYLQNICGVMQLSSQYPTKLDLNSNWDKTTVKDGKAFFYMVDKDGKLKNMPEMSNTVE